jgi:hypothetical protein
MNWSMPRPVLQVVAGLIAVTALGAFVSGILNAPQRGRLPGDHLRVPGAAAPIVATDATPLTGERIEGPPPPPEPTPEQKARAEAERKAKEQAAAELAIETAASARTSLPGPVTSPAADKLGDVLDAVTPPADDPPH